MGFYDNQIAKQFEDSIETPFGKITFKLNEGRYLHARGDGFRVLFERDWATGTRYHSELADTWQIVKNKHTKPEFYSTDSKKKRAKILNYLAPRALEWLTAHKAEIQRTRLATLREQAWNEFQWADQYRQQGQRNLDRAEREGGDNSALELAASLHEKSFVKEVA